MLENQLARPVANFFARRSNRLALLIVALAFILGGAAVMLPGHFIARANAASITIKPASASYSNQVSFTVQGSNFAANETVNIYFGYSGPGTGTLETSPVASAAGSFSARFKMPLVATGTYTIGAVGQTSGLVATGTAQILPQMYMSPKAAGPGTNAFFFGNAFGANEQVNIYWNYTGPGTGSLLTTVTANNTGSFHTTAHIPSGTPSGTIPVVAIGQSSQTSATFGFILYSPLLTVAPLSGAAGSLVTVSAYGFTALEKVNIYWNNGNIPVITKAANTFGYMAPVSFTVPTQTLPGNFSIKATGVKSQLTITNAFTVVAPSTLLTSVSGPTGSRVTITGNGYAPGETVNILWNYSGPSTGTTVATAAAGYAGTFTTSFLVPASATGSYQVAAVGATSQIVTQHPFSINTGLAIDPAATSPGTTVTVTGTGFQVGETVRVFLDGTSGTALASAAADSNGNLNTPVVLPTSVTPGAHTLIGVGQTSNQSFSAALTVNTNWGDFGFDSAHSRYNPDEYGVGTTNASSLTLKWSASTAQLLRSSPVYANGIVYVGTHDGILMAYNATTGAVEWQFNSNTGFEIPSAPLVDPVNNLVFFGTMGFEDSGIPSPFYALNATTGQLVWSEILPYNNFGFPSLHFNTIYIGSSHEGGSAMLNAIDELSGHVVWQYATPGGVWGAVAADTVNGVNTVFTGIGNPGNAIVSLNAATGAVNWSYSTSARGDDDVGSGIVVSNGLVYANSKNGTLYAIHENDGTLAWSTPIGPANIGNVSTPAIGPDGTLYVGSLDNHLYALNSTTGAILRTTTVSNGVDSSPAVANGVVYFASFDNNIYAANASTGAILWSFATNRKSYGSPVIANGWLYCTSTDGKIYAFSL